MQFILVYFRFACKLMQYIYLLITVSFSGYNKKDVGSEGRGYLWKADDKNEEDEEEQRQSLWGEEKFSVVTWGWTDRPVSGKVAEWDPGNCVQSKTWAL